MALLPAGVPKWIRAYDNGGTDNEKTGSYDRYTVVFTGRYRHKTMNCQWYVTSSADPYWAQGVYVHGEFQAGMHHFPKRQWAVDRPVSSHLGKRIKWDGLPKDVQDAVLRDYLYLWDLGPGRADGPPSRGEARRFARAARAAG